MSVTVWYLLGCDVSRREKNEVRVETPNLRKEQMGWHLPSRLHDSRGSIRNLESTKMEVPRLTFRCRET